MFQREDDGDEEAGGTCKMSRCTALMWPSEDAGDDSVLPPPLPVVAQLFAKAQVEIVRCSTLGF